MPLYPYKCPSCGHQFEIKKEITLVDTVAWCPMCGVRTERQFTPVNWSFGWRLTDASHERFGPKNEMEKDV